MRTQLSTVVSSVLQKASFIHEGCFIVWVCTVDFEWSKVSVTDSLPLILDWYWYYCFYTGTGTIIKCDGFATPDTMITLTGTGTITVVLLLPLSKLNITITVTIIHKTPRLPPT